LASRHTVRPRVVQNRCYAISVGIIRSGSSVMTLRMSLGLIAILIGAPSAPCEDAVPAELRSAIDQVDVMTAAEFAKDQLGSVTVGVVSPAGLVWTKSYGYADMEKKLSASRDTVYRIGSITKQFTAVMLLQLTESGQLHLSDPVAQ
jgi:CubicO group peptidase (beta-lactamase class C family)